MDNAARSQIARFVAELRFGPSAHVQSAGLRPSQPHPMALEVLGELGCEVEEARARSVSDVDQAVDLVITVCEEAICPVSLSRVEQLRWPLPDPSVPLENQEAMLFSFRQVRDALDQRLIELGQARHWIPRRDLTNGL